MKAEPRSPERQDAIALAALEAELRREDGYARDGHTARTLLREPDLRIVFIVMRPGASMAPHQVGETGSIHVVTGQVRVRFPERVVDLTAGQLLIIGAGATHEIDGMSESAFVLTIGWHGKA
jgi:quercetin dioxygenase-like cupin family protein